jgi:hypothetical protein
MGIAIGKAAVLTLQVGHDLASAGVAQAADSRRYRCQDGTSFEVAVSNRTAEVTFSPSERYRLKKKRLSLGERFARQARHSSSMVGLLRS